MRHALYRRDAVATIEDAYLDNLILAVGESNVSPKIIEFCHGRPMIVAQSYRRNASMGPEDRRV